MSLLFRVLPRLLLLLSGPAFGLGAGLAEAQVSLIQNGQPQAVILTKSGALGSVQFAAQELQEHLQRMSGALLPIDAVGTEANYPGKKFIYVGASSATTAAGINTATLTPEFYVIKVVNNNLCIAGRDAGQDDWTDLSDCQPGTLLGVYHLLGEVLGVRWIWPGESGRFVPGTASVSLPANLNITAGPAMEQRKYRTPRLGNYLSGSSTYGFGVPVLPASNARKTELALDELKWLRRMRMGSRKSPSFAHSFTTWWAAYGATHPEYFAVLPSGKTQPHPAADRVKLHVSGPAVWQQRVDDWVAAGAGSSLNISPNDSRSHCICASCLAWDRPSQAPEVVFDSSDAKLGDRYARFYTEIANKVKQINPNTTVYATAYDIFRNAPLEATVPDNVAIAYVPGPPSDVLLDQIAETESNVLGWIAHGCRQMYLRPNWMLSAHAGPYAPIHRLGDHFKRLTASGNIKGIDSDSLNSSYAGFGLYHYLLCRLIADPALPVDGIIDEYCSAFGSASANVRAYFAFWEDFINSQADGGNAGILGWSTCMAAYPGSYSDLVFDQAQQLLTEACAALAPAEADAKARLDFLRTALIHGRLTAHAISLVSPAVSLANNPKAEKAMRALLAYRNENAESFALWREWMIDRESFVPGMQDYWTAILANPDAGYGSNLGSFIESGGQVVMEAEHRTASLAGTGAAAGSTWQEVSGITGASGTVMQALPNSGIAIDTGTYGPRLDFKIDFKTTGTYNIFLHLPTLSGTDDSVNVGLDGALVNANLGNTTGSWRWRTTSPATAGLNITTPGVHTFHVWMREDGCIVDKIILTTNAAFSLAGADLGPAESGTRGNGPEYLLSVSNGTGDGYFGEASSIVITANAPPAGYIFDRWTGDVSSLADHLSETTVATMPSQDIAVTAAFRLDPAGDTDHDGIPDAWETAHFHNLTTAGAAATSDYDKDGASDLAEFLAGTAPDDALSHLKVRSITLNGDGDVTLQWQSIPGKTYTIESNTGLAMPDWVPVASGILAIAPSCQHTVHLAPPALQGFLRVKVE